MRGIIYDKDGESIEIVENSETYCLPPEILNKNDTLIVLLLGSFGFNFRKFFQKEKLISKIFEYEKKYGEVNKILFIFNEVIVDPDPIYKLENEIFKKCYYSSFDIEEGKDGKKIFMPLSLLSQLNYALDSGYLNARGFLSTMTHNYYNLIKPHKAVFLSNHVSPIRIEIFNILKNTDNLKNCAWSFQDRLVYYSGEDHDLDKFFKENSDIIPYSYDGFNDKSVSLKSTYFYQFESYFEICTESYFFKDIKGIEGCCPLTEKIVKPVLSFIPFIFFGSPRTKSNLERIGLEFKCPLYGFYDNTDKNSTMKGLEHLKSIITMDIKEIHQIYFDHFGEFTRNNDAFLNHFITLKKSYNIFNSKII